MALCALRRAGNRAKISKMAKKPFDSPVFRSRPLLNVAQVVFLLVIVGAIIVAIDLNRRAQAGRLVGSGEEALRLQVEGEATRQVELQATLDYVVSDDYVAAYARNEGGMILPGERRIVPLLQEATPEPTALPAPTPDPALEAQPWQAWWRLLTDAPQPTR
jgi:cell division protein FtsB